MQTASPRAGRTPADPDRCHHLSHAGSRCTMPTLRDKDLCYRHGHREKVLRIKPAVPDDFPLAPIVTFCYMEDHDDVLANINALADAFSRHAVNHAQVSSLTYLMNTALKTLKQMSEIETKITAEEIVRDVTYNDLNQPRAADPDPEPAPEPKPAPEAEPQPEAESQPEPELQLEAKPQLEATTPTACHPEEQSDEESAVALPPAILNESKDLANPSSDTPQPTTIHTLNATADPNPIASHTYKNHKKQPTSFHTLAETRGEGGQQEQHEPHR